jgi:hypothetical protein
MAMTRTTKTMTTTMTTRGYAMLAALALLLGEAKGFAVVGPQSAPSFTIHKAHSQHSEMDTMCLENLAHYCLEQDCSVADREAVENSLELEVKFLEDELAEMQAYPVPYQPMDVSYHQLWSEMDIMCLLNTMQYCQESDTCSSTVLDGLANRINEQKTLLSNRLKEYQTMAYQLKDAIHHDESVMHLMTSIQKHLSMEFTRSNRALARV